MIESARFVNVNGAQVVFNDDQVPFRRFSTSVEGRTSERAKGQRHGIWPARTFWGKRIFNCEGDLLLNSSGEYWQKRLQLMNAIMPRGQFTNSEVGTLYITFTGINEELTCVCSLDGYPDLPIEAMAPARSAFLINFKAFDPKLYGDGQYVTMTLEEPEGRTYDKTYPRSYPQSIQTNEAVVINGGNIESYPAARIYGPCDDPSLSVRLSNGLVMEVVSDGLSIADGQWVELDFSKPSALRDDGTNVYRYFVGSDWWALEPTPMSNTVRFFASTWSAPSRAELFWKNTYML